METKVSSPGGYAQRLREVCRGLVASDRMICSCRWSAKRPGSQYRSTQEGVGSYDFGEVVCDLRESL
jgi:hypothetical protein